MDPHDYIAGTPIRVRTVIPDDQVWIADQPVKITEVRYRENEQYTLIHADGEFSARGSYMLARGERRVDAPRTVNVVDQQRRIENQRRSIIDLQAKVEARELELAECREQHEHDLTRIKALAARSHELIDADNRARNLEKQIRAQDKALRTQHDHIGELRAALDTIEQAATSARR